MAAAVAAAYHNSFSGVFLFDDRRHIISSLLQTDSVHRVLSFGQILKGQRPVLQLTFVLNHFFGGLNPWGYHAVNLAIHFLAGLVLFGVIRRTLLTERLKVQYGSKASSLALAASLLWLIHPLQTESVTYIIQRAESLMGLFYVLVLYSWIRGWFKTAIVFSALGMATKEIMVTAPLIILLYDRIFLSVSWKQIYVQKRVAYAGLFATWGILVLAIFLNAAQIAKSSGFGFKGVTSLQYALTQPEVILHYLKLSFWPYPLVIDYQWPVVQIPSTIFLPALVIGVLIVLTWWAFRHRPEIGFLGAWFFIILIPSSSFIPIADLAFEHRMYLPLAALVTLAVCAGYTMLKNKTQVTSALIIFIVIVFVVFTHQRNEDYRSEIRIWRDTTEKRPENWRAFGNLGTALLNAKEFDAAILSYENALKINPNYSLAHYNIATVLDAEGKQEEAARHYQDALRLDPSHAFAHSNLGTIFSEQGKIDEAIFHYESALKLNPNFAEGYYNLGNAYLKQGRYDEAVAEYSKALGIKPGFKAASQQMKVAQEGGQT